MKFAPTDVYKRQAKKALNAGEQANVDAVISATPTGWPTIAGTGGARKARVKLDNTKGKSGGARVIYYYVGQDDTVYLFMIYKKSAKENITGDEKKALKSLTTLIKKELEGRK